MDPADELSRVDSVSLSELSDDVAETAQVLISAGNVVDTLSSVVNLSVATIDGCDYAGVFLLEHDVVTTPAYTDPIVVEVDVLQHESKEGPCLDAIAHRMAFYAEDLTTEVRWPIFSQRAAAAGIRSVLALPLSLDGQLGAVNLYAHLPIAFGVVARAKAAILASLAGLALTVAQSHDDEERRILNFQAALTSREIIGEALGILMERERISADQAFDVLRRASQHLNIKLREVAQNLVDTGEDPETGSARLP
jgi:GAF domain-containing protein